MKGRTIYSASDLVISFQRDILKSGSVLQFCKKQMFQCLSAATNLCIIKVQYIYLKIWSAVASSFKVRCKQFEKHKHKT